MEDNSFTSRGTLYLECWTSFSHLYN